VCVCVILIEMLINCFSLLYYTCHLFMRIGSGFFNVPRRFRPTADAGDVLSDDLILSAFDYSLFGCRKLAWQVRCLTSTDYTSGDTMEQYGPSS
jgi:hypothetical protein